jgi:hypothetical protein
MSYGVVVKMNNGWATTPNEGVVRDLETDIEYPFYREPVALGIKLTVWNIHKHDLISFTIVNGIATLPVLYKTHEKNTVFYNR